MQTKEFYCCNIAHVIFVDDPVSFDSFKDLSTIEQNWIFSIFFRKFSQAIHQIELVSLSELENLQF
jgi:hypothetical protein